MFWISANVASGYKSLEIKVQYPASKINYLNFIDNIKFLKKKLYRNEITIIKWIG